MDSVKTHLSHYLDETDLMFTRVGRPLDGMTDSLWRYYMTLRLHIGMHLYYRHTRA